MVHAVSRSTLTSLWKDRNKIYAAATHRLTTLAYDDQFK